METQSSIYLSLAIVLLSMPSSFCNNGEHYYKTTIGAGTIVQPNVQMIAEAGPIIIGASNVIGERTKIINRLPVGQQPPVLVIGSGNVFEADCTIEAPKIGDNNVFKSKSYIGSEVTITDGCVIGAGCRLISQQIVSKGTVVQCP